MKDTARGRGRLASKLQLKWRKVFLENVRPDAPEVQPDPYTTGVELYSYQWFRQLLFSTKSKVLQRKILQRCHTMVQNIQVLLGILGRMRTGHKVVATIRALL